MSFNITISETEMPASLYQLIIKNQIQIDIKYEFCKKSLRENKTLTSCPFFGGVQQQTQPKVIKKMKKRTTGQSFIRKEVTSYKILTLGYNTEFFEIRSACLNCKFDFKEALTQ